MELNGVESKKADRKKNDKLNVHIIKQIIGRNLQKLSLFSCLEN